MDEFREAASVHLHDPRLIITADILTHATDSQFNSTGPEYTLSSPLARAFITQVLGVMPDDVDEVGVQRGYAEYPCDSSRLQTLDARIVSDRMIDLRLTLTTKNGNGWIEEWTYSGSFTVKWMVKDNDDSQEN